MAIITRITNLHELAEGITRHYADVQTMGDSKKILEKGFVFGYRCQEGDAVGQCCLIQQNGLFMIDAYNEGLPMFLAISIVKKVIQEAFKKFTDCVFTVYDAGSRESKVFARRVGFKYLTTIQGKELFFFQREG